MPLNPVSPETLARLEAMLGAGGVRPADANYLTEPRDLYRGVAAAVLRPETTEQVAEVLKLCNAGRHAVVPFGGGTGLVGGQLANTGPAPLVLSLERMNRVRAVDPQDGVMVVEAGLTLAEVRGAADAAGRLFPLSLASEGSCRIGGNLATNAGGVNVLRYGNMRDLCLGIEAVLADGSVLNGLKGLRKDNTGYDMRHLLIGSEGSLGVITAADLRLFPRPAEVEAAFLFVPGPDQALSVLRRLQDELGDVVSAFELVSRTSFAFLAEAGTGLKPPLPQASDWAVLLECGGGRDSNLEARLQDQLAAMLEAGWILDAALAQNESQRAAFWAIRETIPLANRRIGSVSSHDISVRVARLPEFLRRGTEVIAAIHPGLRINAFGHLGDGNLHYNVFPPQGQDRADFAHLRAPVRIAVHDLVHVFGGSISAEHGIGRLKTDDLRKYGDPAKLAAMRAIKSALDPNGILNPGVFFG